MTMQQGIAALYGWACEWLYHEFAGSYDWVAWGVSGGAWDAWRRTALDFVQGTRVVELGSGTGHLARSARQQGLNWVGVDLSPNMLAVAQRLAGAHSDSQDFIRATAEHLPLADGSVDTVVATFPAPFIFSQRTLSECRRVLQRPSGQLVIAGLWVQPSWARRLSLPILYGEPSEYLLDTIRRRLVTLGYCPPTVHAIPVEGAEVGVLVAKPDDTR